MVRTFKNESALLYDNKIILILCDIDVAHYTKGDSAIRGVNHKMPLCIFAGQQIIGGSLCDCDLSVRGEVELITAVSARKCRDCPDQAEMSVPC